jgi:hypothetical protein
MHLVVASAILWSLSVRSTLPQTPSPGDGFPARYLAPCEADLSGDGQPDLALLIETVRGTELIALVSGESNPYRAFLLLRHNQSSKPGILACEYDDEVRETRAGRGTGRVFRTPGAYVHLVWPESSSVAYVWLKDTFVEVWTGD